MTDCCGVPLASDQRFCPRCGWEARVTIKPPRPTGLTYVDDFGHDWSENEDKSGWPPEWTKG